MERYRLNLVTLITLCLILPLVSRSFAFPSSENVNATLNSNSNTTEAPTTGRTTLAAGNGNGTTVEETTTIGPESENGTTTVSSIALATKVEDCNSTVCEDQICRIHRDSISRPSFYARCPPPGVETSVSLSGSMEEENGTTTTTTPSPDFTKYCMCSAAYHVAASSDMHEQSYVQVTVPPNCQPPTPSQESLCEQRVCQGNSNKVNKAAHICEYEEKFYCACFN